MSHSKDSRIKLVKIESLEKTNQILNIPTNTTSTKKKILIRIILSFFLLTIVIVFFYIFIVTPHEIQGESVTRPFRLGEIVLGEKISYLFKSPQIGDRIIFRQRDYSNDFVGVILDIGEDGKYAVRSSEKGEDWKISKGDIKEKIYFPLDYQYVPQNYTVPSAQKRTNEDLLNPSPTDIIKTTPKINQIIVSPTAPTPTPVVKKTTIGAKYFIGDYFYFAANGFKATIIDKSGNSIYEIGVSPIWKIDNIEPGEYVVRIKIASGFRLDTINCSGQCQSVGYSGTDCDSKFTIKENETIEVTCLVAPTDFSTEQADNVGRYALGPPDVDIRYPGNSQVVELEGTNYICLTEVPRSNGRGLVRRMNVNHASWSSFKKDDLPCFNAHEGQNSIEVQYRNEGGYETPIIQRDFYFHRK